MKTDELMMELETLQYTIERLEKDIKAAKEKRKSIIDEIEMNLINDCFEAKN